MKASKPKGSPPVAAAKTKVANVAGKPRAAAAASTDKRTRGGDAPTELPVFIRAEGSGMGADDRAYLRRKLGRRLDKFSADVLRVSVRMADINGPRGGIDWQCRIKVVLRGLPSVMVESRELSVQLSMDRALAKLGTAVRRALQQRRTVLRKPRSGARQATIGE